MPRARSACGILCLVLASLVMQNGVPLRSEPATSEIEFVQMIDNGGTIARPGEDPSETLKRADGFLYRSKEAGRDRVTCA